MEQENYKPGLSTLTHSNKVHSRQSMLVESEVIINFTFSLILIVLSLNEKSRDIHLISLKLLIKILFESSEVFYSKFFIINVN